MVRTKLAFYPYFQPLCKSENLQNRITNDKQKSDLNLQNEGTLQKKRCCTKKSKTISKKIIWKQMQRYQLEPTNQN